MMTMGDRIKEFRLRIGMTQEELATKVGYKSRSSVNKIEIGDRKIRDREMIEKFAKALGVKPQDIVGLNREVDDLDYAVFNVYPDWDPQVGFILDYSSIDMLHNYCVSEFPNDYKEVEGLIQNLNRLNSKGIIEAHKRILELSCVDIYSNEVKNYGKR